MRGSSPHTRGAQSPSALAGACGGIIPAYAGSTAKRAAAPGWCGDHPRIRGEHAREFERQPGFSGSSPHTRGARAGVGDAGVEVRIIPAYAGSTQRFGVDVGDRRDHPRIRGEHAQGGIGKLKQGGSSPHTRGALGRSPHAYLLVRIIPAYAGSTLMCPSVSQSPTDHPRIRGEHQSAMMTYLTLSGSSPHTRGARR